MSQSLVLSETIIGVHDDLSEWAIISAGFDDDKNFVVCMTYDKMESYRDDEPVRWEKDIVVDRAGTEKLLRSMRVPLLKLPHEFYKRFGTEKAVWGVTPVSDTFNAILCFLERQNVRYTIKKNSNK